MPLTSRNVFPRKLDFIFPIFGQLLFEMHWKVFKDNFWPFLNFKLHFMKVFSLPRSPIYLLNPSSWFAWLKIRATFMQILVEIRWIRETKTAETSSGISWKSKMEGNTDVTIDCFWRVLWSKLCRHNVSTPTLRWPNINYIQSQTFHLLFSSSPTL